MQAGVFVATRASSDVMCTGWNASVTEPHVVPPGDAAAWRHGPFAGEIADGDAYEWGTLPNLFLYSRADTIYGGTNQIQRNIIAERALGMPKEPRAAR